MTAECGHRWPPAAASAIAGGQGAGTAGREGPGPAPTDRDLPCDPFLAEPLDARSAKFVQDRPVGGNSEMVPQGDKCQENLLGRVMKNSYGRSALFGRATASRS